MPFLSGFDSGKISQKGSVILVGMDHSSDYWSSGSATNFIWLNASLDLRAFARVFLFHSSSLKQLKTQQTLTARFAH